jgi:diguanylate cyclase (GGDEF)-like protein/PAS domain S-box-containing protein
VPPRHIIAANEAAKADTDSLGRLRAAIAKGAANDPDTPKNPAGEDAARKQAAARLQGSRTVASIAERLTHMGAWSVELPALSLTVSDEVLAIHGILPGGALTVEESIGQYAPECRETITRAFGACVNSGTPFDLDVQLITPGGQRVWVRSVGEAVRDASGVIQRVQGAIQEISEHTQATAETRQQLAERLTTTLESITDAFFTLDREWRFTFVNREAERLLQRPRAELIGADWRKEFSAAVDAAFGIEYRRAIAENRSVEFEEFYPPLNTWFSVRAYPSSEGLAVYFLDITERKRMEKMLRESEAEFRTLAEGMPQMVWVTNPAGETTYFNHQWVDYTGLTMEESLGSGWNKPFHPEDQQSAWRAWQRAMAGIDIYSIECRLRRADGIYRWWLVRGVPLRDANGIPVKWLGTCTDIHDLKVAEVEIARAMAKMKESDEKFHQLADNVTDVFWVASPDLRTVHYVSPAYEQIWGRSVESQYAHPGQWTDAIVPPDREHVFTAVAGLAADKAVVSLDCQIERPDASVRWIHIRGFRVEDTTGQLIRIAGIASDITERKHSEEAIERALQRLNDAQRIGRIGDWGYDIASGAVKWSPEMFELLGRDPRLGPPRDLEEATAVYDAASRAFIEENFRRAIESGEPQHCELVVRQPGGQRGHVLAESMPKKDENGKVVGLYGTLQDISARKRDEQAIRDRAHQQELIATLGRSALANTDLDILFTEAGSAIAQGLNVEFSKVLQLMGDEHSFILKAGAGWKPAWLGQHTSSADGGIRLAEILAGKPSIIDDFLTEQPVSTSTILRAHGISSGVDVAIVCSDGPWGVLGGYSRDVRQFGVEHLDFLRSIANILGTGIDRRRREEQLVRLAHYDTLTNLPNKVFFNDRLAAAIVQSRHSGGRTAVLYLDLDRFKNVNDAFGHGQGDRLLQEVARRLASLTRASDTLSRQGGDEFLVLMPGMEIGEDPARFAEQLIRSMDSDVNVGFDEAVPVTCSIGIACFPDDGKDAETVLRNADAAMYAAKEAGRNCYRFYSGEMNARAHERHLLVADLGKAIARGELFLQFQPQVAMDSGVVTGMEALARWRHPVLGLVPPGQFIPLAEESGLIVSIGGWVLETACRQQAQWVREGVAHGRMAVNVSAVQFRQPSLLGTVGRTLERTGLDPRCLELELTESIVLRGADGVGEKLTELNKLGVTLAIDDFGTGQSNLSYLTQFPIHRLKIDQSFVRGIPADKKNGAITQAIISMGHSLGLTVIAEGVETEAQAEYLQSLWCDEAQGHYYSRPLYPADCGAFLRCETPRPNPAAPEGT